ncbi:MAG TPA: hypothetical protein VNI55_06240 [Gaiellaceae bacterium]|nr:hypothetical protein [Gaiellaceae bacterium]
MSEPAGQHPEALELLRLAQLALELLALRDPELGPRVLACTPGDDAEHGCEEDERTVDSGPQPGATLVRIDLAEADARGESVMDDDEADREQEDQPVLVQGQRDQEDEEEEVRLGDAAGNVNAEGSGREEAGDSGRSLLHEDPESRNRGGGRPELRMIVTSRNVYLRPARRHFMSGKLSAGS